VHSALDAALIPLDEAVPALAMPPHIMLAPAPVVAIEVEDVQAAEHHLAPFVDTPAEVQEACNRPMQDDAALGNVIEDLLAGLMDERQVPGEEVEDSDDEDADNNDDMVTVSGRDVQKYEDVDDASVFTVRAL
jgi:hypothetical protein